MKKRLFSVSLLVILTLLLVSPFPAAAKAEKLTVCGLETNYKDVGGQQWVDSSNVLHIRGQTSYAKIESLPGHPECDPTYSNGQLQITVNVDLNLTTGVGAAWGMSTLTPTGVKGTFVGPYYGKIQGFLMTARSLSFGTGKLKGQIEANTIEQTGQTTYVVHGFVFAR